MERQLGNYDKILWARQNQRRLGCGNRESKHTRGYVERKKETTRTLPEILGKRTICEEEKKDKKNRMTEMKKHENFLAHPPTLLSESR